MSKARKASTKTAARPRTQRYRPTPFDHGAVRAQYLSRYKATGERLLIARAVLNISEEEAAAAFGVPIANYQRYEAGQTDFDKGRWRDGWLRFCLKYDISTDWLVCGDGRFLKPHMARRGKVVVLPIRPCFHRDFSEILAQAPA